MSSNPATIRCARASDAQAVSAIWLEGAKQSYGSRIWNLEDVSPVEFFKARITTLSEPFGVWVAESPDFGVVGWQALSPLNLNPLTNHVIAVSSTYIAVHMIRSGIGEQLLRFAMRQADETGLEFILGFVSGCNFPALGLVSKCGWDRIGSMPRKGGSQTPPIQLVVYSGRGR